MNTERPRLLIVDDEAAQLRALCDTLHLEGYTVRGFPSPRQALQELRAGQYDLILTDLKMPEMDGIEFARAACVVDPLLGVIVMTGHGTIDTAVQAMQEGAVDYILKPFKLKVILPVITRALNGQRLRRENAALQEREQRRSEELAHAYQALESFSYSISHDLRSPLLTIQGFATMLEEDYAQRLGDEGRRLIETICATCQRMDQLISGLLAFSQAGRRPFERSSIEMKALAEGALAQELAGYSGPRPEISVGELPACVGDATVLRQVWCNLIGNALKYSAKRAQPHIEIDGRAEGTMATYTVRDNGAGFDMRYVDKLFGVFQRLHSTTEFAGTGVGLAIVQRIVARHGGRIVAVGAPDGGACFQFSLPTGPDQAIEGASHRGAVNGSALG